MTKFTTTALMGLTIFTLAACGGGSDVPETVEPGLAVGDSLVPINDAPLPTEQPAPVVEAPAATPPAATPRPTPRPTTPRPTPAPVPAPAPAPAPAALSLPAGVTLAATTIDSIHSRYNKAGDVVRMRVASDVTAADGRVVIPAGSVVTLAVVEIAPAANKGESATLVMSVRHVSIDGTNYPMTARLTAYDSELKSRGVGAGEVAKTGAGAVAGGIIGRVVGGKTGTVVGAVGGAAAGAAIADKTVDRDIVVHAGSRATITLRDDFTRGD